MQLCETSRQDKSRYCLIWLACGPNSVPAAAKYMAPDSSLSMAGKDAVSISLYESQNRPVGVPVDCMGSSRALDM